MQYPDGTPRWRRYLRLIRRDTSADVDDELGFHFESRIEELTAQGMNAHDAHDRALREFGDVSTVRRGLVSIGDRSARRQNRAERLADVLRDVAYAVRSLRRTPGVALAILLTLALGVGANAAIFTLVDAIFLKPPAGVVNPDGVHRLWMRRVYSTDTRFSVVASYVQFEAVRAAVGDRGRVAVYRIPTTARVGRGENTTDLQLSYAGADYFSVLGVHASVGRLFSEDEDRIDARTPVVVLSEAYWRRAFNGDPSAIGQSIIIAATKFTVVGIAASSFAGTELNAADAWLPLSHYSSNRASATPWWRNQRANGLAIIARPNAGVNERELEQRITAALRNPNVWLANSDSTTTARFGSIVSSNGPGIKSQEEQIAVRLTGVAAIVLIIACANVVNLLLARAVRRRREIAVRLALGAGRGRLIRLLLAESGVLAVLAALLAIIVAYWGGALLRKLLLPDIHWAGSPIDWRVMLFVLSTATGAGLVAGLVPALQSASPELTSSLKIGTGSGLIQHSRLRASLVVAQAALSVLLLVGAMLFVRSLSNVRELDIGYDPASLVTATVRFDDRTRGSDPTFQSRLAELARHVAEVRGVEQVALSSMPPMSGFSWISYFTDTDSSGSRPGFLPTVTGVSRGYFAATGLQMLRGTDFPTEGPRGQPSVIVNQSMAKTLWSGRNAIGQCIRFGTPTERCYYVIGIVENSRRGSVIEKEEAAQYYLPLDNLPDSAKGTLGAYYLALRVSPARFAAASNDLRSLIRQQFPSGIPVITRLSDYIDPQYRPWRLGALLFTGFGVLALVVAVVGIYSTVSYGVNQRIHEFGVRIALGASIADVLRLVVGAGMHTVALGVAIGLVLALLAGRLVASLLYGVVPSDPVVLGSVGAVLLAIGILAALAPAWRAARVDPVVALRAD